MGNTTYTIYSRNLETDRYDANPRCTSENRNHAFGYFKHDFYDFALQLNGTEYTKCIYLYENSWRLAKVSRPCEKTVKVECRTMDVLRLFLYAEEKLHEGKWPLREQKFNRTFMQTAESILTVTYTM